MKSENWEKSWLQSEPKLTLKQHKDLDYAQGIAHHTSQVEVIKPRRAEHVGVGKVIGMFMQ